MKKHMMRVINPRPNMKWTVFRCENCPAEITLETASVRGLAAGVASLPEKVLDDGGWVRDCQA